MPTLESKRGNAQNQSPDIIHQFVAPDHFVQHDWCTIHDNNANQCETTGGQTAAQAGKSGTNKALPYLPKTKYADAVQFTPPTIHQSSREIGRTLHVARIFHPVGEHAALPDPLNRRAKPDFVAPDYFQKREEMERKDAEMAEKRQKAFAALKERLKGMFNIIGLYFGDADVCTEVRMANDAGQMEKNEEPMAAISLGEACKSKSALFTCSSDGR